MGNEILDVRELALYYDGKRFHFGKMYEGSFIAVDGVFCQHLDNAHINTDFKLREPSVMILRDAIEGNVYGEDRNKGLENAGLDKLENQYINALYKAGEVGFKDLMKHAVILSNRIQSRMEAVEAESLFMKEFSKLVTESDSEMI